MRYLFLLLFIWSCKSGIRQEIIIQNKTSKNILYIIQQDQILNANEIKLIRPKTDKEIKDFYTENEVLDINKEDSLKSVYTMKTNFLIKPDESKTIFSSRAVSVYVDKESIQEQISNYFNDTLRVSIIKEEDLLNHSEAEIINKKLYKPFLKLTEKDIKEDIMSFEYK